MHKQKTYISPVRAFFFDLDGTLVDTEPAWIDAVRNCLADCSISMSDNELETLIFGRSWIDIHADLSREHPERCGNRHHMEKMINHHFSMIRKERDSSISGSVQLLMNLASNWPVAIVSGSGRNIIESFIIDLGIADHVSFFIGCEDYPAGKPDPACYLMAAKRLEIDPSCCTVFEDSHAGVRAAKAAGMRCIALKRPGALPQDLSHADAILPDLALFTIPD